MEFKRPVGRPTNESKKNKKILIGLSVALGIVLVVGAGLVLSGTVTLSELMGNSVTVYTCPNGYEKRGLKCVRQITVEPALIGDVNEDGAVNAKDLLLVKKYVAGSTTLTSKQKLTADVNGDKTVDSNDTTMIQEYMAKRITSFEYKNVCFYSEKYYSKTTGDECVKEEAINATRNGYYCPDDYTFKGTRCVKSETVDSILAGDINEDGTIDAKDILLLRQVVEEGKTLTSKQVSLADVVNDNSINSSDVDKLKNYLANSTTISPKYLCYFADGSTERTNSKTCTKNYSMKATKTN